jgi:hypothetical protein
MSAGATCLTNYRMTLWGSRCGKCTTRGKVLSLEMDGMNFVGIGEDLLVTALNRRPSDPKASSPVRHIVRHVVAQVMMPSSSMWSKNLETPSGSSLVAARFTRSAELIGSVTSWQTVALAG